MRILYLMHVDWNWIKQRPHFIAEKLSENGINVDVYYRWNKFLKPLNNKTIKCIKKIPVLKGQRFNLIRKLNPIFYDFFILILTRCHKYDYVFITHPMMYSRFIKNKIIYDCMDDTLSFKLDNNQRKRYYKKEKTLIKKSKILIFSADHLAKTIINRYSINRNYTVLNNAIELPNCFDFNSNITTKDSIVLTYIGTIANWFDFDLLRKVKNKYSNKSLIFNLYGPNDSKNFDESFNFKGTVKHEDIYKIMNDSDILIMPFVLNELIKSVNPVKLYEYIYSGKPIISLKYGETEKFKDYVYLYDNNDENSFIEQIDLIIENNMKGKQELKECFNFVKQNTWNSRVNEILKLL